MIKSKSLPTIILHFTNYYSSKVTNSSTQFLKLCTRICKKLQFPRENKKGD